jgi:hypothetical protein
MQLVMTDAWCMSMQYSTKDEEWMAAATNMAIALNGQGGHSEAESLQRKTLGAQRRVLGDVDTNTLAKLGIVAVSLKEQGKHVVPTPRANGESREYRFSLRPWCECMLSTRATRAVLHVRVAFVLCQVHRLTCT